MAKRKRHNFPRPKASTSARGYGTPHQAARRRWELVVESGAAVCVRCNRWIAPGSRWHLDHRDDKGGYLGVSHAACNLIAGAKLGNARKRARQALDQRDQPGGAKWRTSREW